jgi:CRP/FNR family transcriptional regulator
LKTVQSAFLTQINRHIRLTDSERDALRRLGGQAVALSKRDRLFSENAPDGRIAIVRSGWAVARVRSDGNQTTITPTFMAGDTIGLSDIGFNRPPHETTMQTDGSVHLLSRRALCNLGALNDRLHAITRYTAEDRLMHFLLTVKAKSEQFSEHSSNRFPLPLSQKEIGDALGLTDIYVNRLLRGLQKSGQLSLSRPNVKINERAVWATRLNFQDRYAGLDFSWAN